MQVVQQLEIQVGTAPAPKDARLKSHLLPNSACRVLAALCRREVARLGTAGKITSHPSVTGAHLKHPSQRKVLPLARQRSC